jgi:hypothetical protein
MQKDDCIFLDNNEEDSDANLGEDLNEGLADDNKMERKGNDVNDLSGEDESDLYTSASCKVTLAKVSKHLSCFLYTEILKILT